MESGNWEIAALNRLWFFRYIFQAAQSCLHCSHFPLVPAPPLTLQIMKLAFEPVPVPLPSSCFPVLRDTWWTATVLAALEVPPSCLVLGLEQNTKCFVFLMHCSCLGGKACIWHPDPKAQGGEGQQRASGTCRSCWRECWEKFGAAWGPQLSGELMWIQSLLSSRIQPTHGQKVLNSCRRVPILSATPERA